MRIILAILFVAYLLIKHDRLRHVVFFPVKLLFGCIGVGFFHNSFYISYFC